MLKMGLGGRRFATVEDIKKSRRDTARDKKKTIFINVTTTG
jgi:hypothetical protein